MIAYNDLACSNFIYTFIIDIFFGKQNVCAQTRNVNHKYRGPEKEDTCPDMATRPSF